MATQLKHGIVVTDNLLWFTHLFLKQHQMGDTVLASYTLPDPTLLSCLHRGSKVMVSEVVHEADIGLWDFVRRVAPPDGTMHHKFLICGITALVGSWNFRGKDGCNAMVYLHGQEALKLRAEFDRLWPYQAEPCLDATEALALVQAVEAINGQSGFTKVCSQYLATRGTLSAPQVKSLRKLLPPADQYVQPPLQEGEEGGDW